MKIKGLRQTASFQKIPINLISKDMATKQCTQSIPSNVSGTPSEPRGSQEWWIKWRD